MTESNGDGNKTVFRPSPLQALRQGGAPVPGGQLPLPPSASGWAAEPPMATPGAGGEWAAAPVAAAAYAAPVQVRRMDDDDVPQPAVPTAVRNSLLAEAEPILALIGAIRAGRVRMPLPQLHGQLSAAIARFEARIGQSFDQESAMRAKYALCATADDVAQNLPGQAAEAGQWAQRSMVVRFFSENISGDRFWQLIDDMLRTPRGHEALIELYHACLAAGFEGRYRVMPDGRRRLSELMERLFAALEHGRTQSLVELYPAWRGEAKPLAQPGGWSLIALIGSASLVGMVAIFALLSVLLLASSEPADEALAGLMPDAPLRMSRAGGALPVDESTQASRLRTFLAPEIIEGLVVVEEDSRTVRVRTTVGTLFESGSDVLRPERRALFERIGAAIESEKGSVMVEGHADSDRVSGVAFPSNMALSEARASEVAALLRGQLRDGTRVRSAGYGESAPIASNASPEGKSVNRRVEVVLDRDYQDGAPFDGVAL
jgi:type VI secretion system protein ImpK